MPAPVVLQTRRLVGSFRNFRSDLDLQFRALPISCHDIVISLGDQPLCLDIVILVGLTNKSCPRNLPLRPVRACRGSLP